MRPKGSKTGVKVQVQKRSKQARGEAHDRRGTGRRARCVDLNFNLHKSAGREAATGKVQVEGAVLAARRSWWRALGSGKAPLKSRRWAL